MAQIVVGPGIEALHPVLDAVAGREDQDRLGEPLAPQALQHVEPVTLGEHQVEHDRVDGHRPRLEVALLPRGRGDDLVALLGQPSLQALQELPLVLDHQET